MIRCTGVHKTYRSGARSVEALRGVDLRVEGPGFYGIMGASGRLAALAILGERS